MIYIINQTPSKGMTFQPIRFELQQRKPLTVPAVNAAVAHQNFPLYGPAVKLSTQSVNN